MADYRLLINGREVRDFDPMEFAVLATWQAKDIVDLNKFGVFYTKSGTLPVGYDLNRAINSPLIIDAKSKFESKPTIDFFVNGENVLSGYLKIISGTVENIGGSISFRIESRDRDWWDEFKTFTMQDLDLDSHSHSLTIGNLRASETYSSSRPYVYAPVDIGSMGDRSILFMEWNGSAVSIFYAGTEISTSTTAYIYGNPNSGANVEAATITPFTNTFWNNIGIYEVTTTDIDQLDDLYLQNGFFRAEDRLWQLHDILPSIRLSDLIDSTYSRLGYTVENSWVTDNLSNRYHFEANHLNRLSNMAARQNFKVAVAEGGLSLAKTSGALTFPFVNRDGIGLIQNTDFDDTDADNVTAIDLNNHTSDYVAPYNMYVRVRALVSFVGNVNYVAVTVYDNPGTTLWQTVSSVSTSTSSAQHYIELVGVAYLPQGYRLRVETNLVSSSPPILFDESTFEITPVTKQMPNAQVHLQDYLTKQTAYQWLKDITQLFNLQIYTDPILKRVTIIADDEKGTDKVLDFTTKLDRRSSADITEIATLHPLKYVFDYLSDGQDWEMQQVEEIYGRVARGEIDNGWPFATETSNKSLSVYAASLNGIASHESLFYLGIPYMRGENDERNLYQSRIFEIEFAYANPSPYLEGTATQMDYDIDGNNVTSFPRATFPDTLHFDSLISNFYKHFSLLLLHGYMIDGRFNITEVDASRFTTVDGEANAFRHKYSIKLNGVEVEAEVYKVEDYDPMSDSFTKCKFIWLKIS